MSRSCVIVCAGKSFDPGLLPQVWAKADDQLVINYAAYPIRDAGLKPTYYLTWDRPDRFCAEWHTDPAVRSLINHHWEPVAKRDRYRNYQTVSLGAKVPPDWNPFKRPMPVRPFKSILLAAQYLVRANYSTVYYWGCDFIPSQEKWYAISKAPLNDQVYRSKVNSNEEQLEYLRRWHPFAAEMGCRWVSLSPISRLNEFMPCEDITGLPPRSSAR